MSKSSQTQNKITKKNEPAGKINNSKERQKQLP